MLATLSRLYASVIMLLIGPKLYDLDAPNFAFRPGHQAHAVIRIFRLAVEKAREWGVLLFVVDGDVRKAYDSTEYWVAIAGLRKKGWTNHWGNHGTLFNLYL